jgi:hypothetical protein
MALRTQIMKVLAVLLVMGAVFLAAIGLLIPNGSDVQRAQLVRFEIEAILLKNGLKIADGENVVMMSVKRRGLEVAVRNPKPDLQTVRFAILNGLSDTYPSVTVGFRDANMKRLEEWRLNLSKDGRREETKLSD